MTRYIYSKEGVMLATIHNDKVDEAVVSALKQWAKKNKKEINVQEAARDVMDGVEFTNQLQQLYGMFLASLATSEKPIDEEFTAVLAGLVHVAKHMFSNFSSVERSTVIEQMTADILQGAFELGGVKGTLDEVEPTQH